MSKVFFICLAIFFIPLISEATIKVGLIGDSICCPYSVYYYPIYPNQCIDYLLERDLDKEGYAVRIINYSVSGSTTETGLSRLKEMIQTDKPQILIIALGINDANHKFSFEKIKGNLSDMIKLASNQQIKVLLGSVDASNMPWRSYSKTYLANLKGVYEDLRNEYPGIILFPFLSQQVTMDADFHVGDHVHPNREGLQLIANVIKPILRSILSNERRDSPN
jgi:acyl-CoA thioesterase-1